MADSKPQERLVSPAVADLADQSGFTEMAMDGIIGAIAAARANKQEAVETEHLMKALLEQKDGLARRIFTNLGLDITSVLQATDEFIAKQPKASGDTSYPALGKHMRSLLNISITNKEDMKDKFVSVEHIILAFYFDKRFGQELLRILRLGWMDLRKAIDAVRESQKREFMNRMPSLKEEDKVDQSDFTVMAWEGINGAIVAAQANKQEVVETEHMMKVLLEQKDGLARRIFTKAGLDSTSILQATDDFISKQPKVSDDTSHPVVGQHINSLLENAIKHKKDMKDEFVSVEHFMLAFYLDRRFGQQLLMNFGLSEKDLRDAIDAVRGSQPRELNEHWGIEKELINQIRTMKEEINRVNVEMEADLNHGAELKKGTLISLQRQLEETEKHLAEIVSKWTGTHFEDVLHQRVVGQNTAVMSVADAIRRSRAGLSDPNRPIASFMFMGSTGVGKSELAKSLADYLFNTEDAFVSIDMNEYIEEHAVPRLVGLLTGLVCRRKYRCVILFDEVEKAHHDVFNTLLQLLDDGKITDCQGRTVSFTNTVIIMTSKIGSNLILDTLSNTHDSKEVVYDIMKEQVIDLAKETFCPELWNSIDEYIVFKPLDATDISNLVEIQMSQLKERLKQRKIELHYTKEAIDAMTGQIFDPNFGATDVKRVIESLVENGIAMSGGFKEDEAVLFNVGATSDVGRGLSRVTPAGIPGHFRIDLGTSGI